MKSVYFLFVSLHIFIFPICYKYGYHFPKITTDEYMKTGWPTRWKSWKYVLFSKIG